MRVAHSLLLTSNGRVLSFGTGQYGALGAFSLVTFIVETYYPTQLLILAVISGHGYSAAKQLPDILRPQYIEALSHKKCVCISAGELHSAAVTADGDVYTWGKDRLMKFCRASRFPLPAFVANLFIIAIKVTVFVGSLV